MSTTLTLAALADSARAMGCWSAVQSIGGNMHGVYFQRGWFGPVFLVTLDEGHESGTSWTVGLSDGSEDSGECPVTSDADQTMTDALAWAGGQRTLPD